MSTPIPNPLFALVASVGYQICRIEDRPQPVTRESMYFGGSRDRPFYAVGRLEDVQTWFPDKRVTEVQPHEFIPLMFISPQQAEEKRKINEHQQQFFECLHAQNP